MNLKTRDAVGTTCFFWGRQMIVIEKPRKMCDIQCESSRTLYKVAGSFELKSFQIKTAFPT